jgi:hypothetical protein
MEIDWRGHVRGKSAAVRESRQSRQLFAGSPNQGLRRKGGQQRGNRLPNTTHLASSHRLMANDHPRPGDVDIGGTDTQMSIDRTAGWAGPARSLGGQLPSVRAEAETPAPAGAVGVLRLPPARPAGTIRLK